MKALISRNGATLGTMDRMIAEFDNSLSGRAGLIDAACNYAGYGKSFVIDIFAEGRFYADPVKVINCDPLKLDEVVETQKWITWGD